MDVVFGRDSRGRPILFQKCRTPVEGHFFGEINEQGIHGCSFW